MQFILLFFVALLVSIAIIRFVFIMVFDSDASFTYALLKTFEVFGLFAESSASELPTSHPASATSHLADNLYALHLLASTRGFLGRLETVFSGVADAPIFRRKSRSSSDEADDSDEESIISVDGRYHFRLSFKPIIDASQNEKPLISPDLRADINCYNFDIKSPERLSVGLSMFNVTTFEFEGNPIEAGNVRIEVAIFLDTALVQKYQHNFTAVSADRVSVADMISLDDAVSYETIPEVVLKEQVPALAPGVPRKRLHLDITFAFNPRLGQSFTFDLCVGSRRTRMEISLREDDLAEIVAGLRSSLDDMRRYFSVQSDTQEDRFETDEHRRLLDKVARRGNDAYKRIFADEISRARLTEALTQNTSGNLEIATEGFLLPWELLYPDYQIGVVTWDSFWGFRYNISRVLTDVPRQGWLSSEDHEPPRVMLLPYPKLNGVRDQEIPFFRGLRSAGKICLRDWLEECSQMAGGSEQLNEPYELRKKLFEFCGQGSDVVQLSCHVAINEAYSRHSCFVLGPDLKVRLEDMNVDHLELADDPVVFLNACGTGVRDSRKTSDFVREFLKSGSRGVIATESDVPDYFAAEFTQQFYRHLLHGRTYGEALLATRHWCLHECNNPLGLLYASYLSLDARLLKHDFARPTFEITATASPVATDDLETVGYAEEVSEASVATDSTEQ